MPLIAEICAKPELYLGRVVKLLGRFQGWQVIQCQFLREAANKPRTRSDWLIRTKTDCLYVTGGFPEDLSPMKPNQIGCYLELEAEVKQDDDDKIYLVYRNSRVLAKKKTIG